MAVRSTTTSARTIVCWSIWNSGSSPTLHPIVHSLLPRITRSSHDRTECPFNFWMPTTFPLCALCHQGSHDRTECPHTAEAYDTAEGPPREPTERERAQLPESTATTRHRAHLTIAVQHAGDLAHSLNPLADGAGIPHDLYAPERLATLRND